MTDSHPSGNAGLLARSGGHAEDMTGSQSPVCAGLPARSGDGDPDHGLRQLAGTLWAVRTAGGPGACPSLEVYADGLLLDVVVATSLSRAVLRGSCRASVAGRGQAIAWGRLPPGGPPVAVTFAAAGRGSRPGTAAVTELGRWFWVAVAEGAVSAVTVTHPGGRERQRIRKIRLTGAGR
jgi:hypothetical protein